MGSSSPLAAWMELYVDGMRAAASVWVGYWVDTDAGYQWSHGNHITSGSPVKDPA